MCKLILSWKLLCPLWRSSAHIISFAKHDGSGLLPVSHPVTFAYVQARAALRVVMLEANDFWLDSLHLSHTVKRPCLGWQIGKKTVKPEKVCASLFGIKTWIADNVHKDFLASNAKTEMLSNYKCFFLTLIFFSL